MSNDMSLDSIYDVADLYIDMYLHKELLRANCMIFQMCPTLWALTTFMFRCASKFMEIIYTYIIIHKQT